MSSKESRMFQNDFNCQKPSIHLINTTNKEMDLDLEHLNLSEFLNISNESGNETNISPNENPKANIVAEQLLLVNSMQIKNKYSFESVTNVVKLMNNMPGTEIKIPEKKCTIQKIIAEYGSEKSIFLVFCDNCNELVVDTEQCKCGVTTRKNSKKNNFLVYLPLVPQVLKILRKHFDLIINFLNREHTANNISHTDTAEIHLKFLQNSNSVPLSLTMNLDGAKIFNSSRGSLWPVQFYLNFLPPHIRYMPENMIVSVLYYGAKKPDITKLLYPLAKELEENKEPIAVLNSDGEIVNFQISILLIACDLPAKAAVQNFVGHNGKFGCSYCYHPGVPVANWNGKTKTIRFIENSHIELRTHSQTVLQSIKCNVQHVVQGIKGPSPALMFSDIDLIKSFPIDIMHAVGLGVLKDLIEIWMGKKKLPTPPFKEYKLKARDRDILNSRILKLKPPLTMHRRPKSIVEIADFKASESLNCLWFYLRYTLPGLLPTKLVKNFEKLSVATYNLFRENITLSEVKFSSDMLADFISEYESIYGQSAITMNVHLLKHCGESVKNCGPMWSYALFGFENNIGLLKNYVCGKTDVLEQIHKKYIASKNEYVSTSRTLKNCMELKQQTNLDVEYAPILTKAGFPIENLKIWRRLKKGDEVFTSIKAFRGKSCDYFVQLKNNELGTIVFYFLHQNGPYCLLNLYEISHTNYHWIEVFPTKQYKIYPCSEINEKMMFFEGFTTKYITRMPNHISRTYC